jgi:uncharacterized protein YPO0396
VIVTVRPFEDQTGGLAIDRVELAVRTVFPCPIQYRGRNISFVNWFRFTFVYWAELSSGKIEVGGEDGGSAKLTFFDALDVLVLEPPQPARASAANATVMQVVTHQRRRLLRGHSRSRVDISPHSCSDDPGRPVRLPALIK